MSRKTGERWERVAERYLAARGLILVERNYTCRVGEIDLVMQIEDTLVMVEVRFRARGARVSALESVDARKQRRLCRAAGMFLSRTRDFDACPVRFDVVAITRVAGVTRVNWQPAAFDCQGY